MPRAIVGVWTASPARAQAMPMARLDAGPAPAIRASRPGLVASDSMVETPPSRNSVMLRTGMPSWMRTETKSSSAAATETTQIVVVDQGSTLNHEVATDHVTRAKMTSQLGWMAISMPNSRPILKPRPMLPPSSGHAECSHCAGAANG